jgi:hypothetical protein
MAIDSRGRYIISRRGAGTILVVLFCILFLPLFFAPPGSIADTIIAYICALLFFLFFYLGFYQTYAFFEGKNFRLVKFFFLRSTIPVMHIESIKRKRTFAGAFSGVEVAYKSDNKQTKHAMIPISAFGAKNIGDMLNKFLEINPSIRAENLVSTLASKKNTKIRLK